MLEIGQLVEGKYRILSKVGQGGMSVVYMAINERANKTWAIKEVRKDTSQRAAVANNGIIVETNMLRQLSHPNMPSIVDVIEDQDSFLIVMDFIEGKTLKYYVREKGAQKQEDVVKWAKQLCGVLGYLHSQDPPIIYRDMKPSNIMLRPDGDVVLFDFGAARKYREESELDDTVCLGTKGYAAPEQYGGHGQTDARTDIYGLGATMYHLITGHNPAEPPYEIYPIRHWNPALSSGLEAIIEKCTMNNPDDRYQDCSELMYALDHYWESDESYRKEQVSNLHRFLIPAALTLVFGAAAISMQVMQGKAKNNDYETYLKAARSATTQNDQVSEVENLRKAIALDPTRAEAYDYLLNNVYLDDEMFTAEENAELNRILYESDTLDTNDKRFSEGNKKGYAKFAYDLGIAYYYKYYEPIKEEEVETAEKEEESEGTEEETEANADAAALLGLRNTSNRKSAKVFFEVAQRDDYRTFLTEKEGKRAERLYMICNYYPKLLVPDATGDTSVSFADYWLDLQSLTTGNIVDEDNSYTAVMMYKQLLSELTNYSWKFRRAGVAQEDIKALLDEVDSRLDTDFQGISDEYILNSISELEKNLSIARRSVDSAYGKGGDRV
ncbi:MAG: serine/threonine protein kinase [Lachnospiraceae bacterium]|nr:serine/threonine protein kinase [Lachnospiraceae bacterium]